MIDSVRKRKLDKLLELIEFELKNYELLNVSLTHPSYVFEKGNGAGEHNQRLEFLGDAVVGLIIGEYLYKQFPEKSEGELTKMRAALVCEGTLAKAADRIGLGQYLLMGKGERNGGGARRPSNLADAWEALVGALYLDSGIDKVESFVIKYIKPDFKRVILGNYGDYKTQLQELVQKNPEQILEYKILFEKGPDHEKEFTAGIFLGGKMLAQGNGRTKKEAEQKAAQQALILMGEINV